MKNIAIIAEYNPLHNGHIYHINEVKNDNNIIVALSGNFTERGDIAVANKYNRARMAIEHGADMVIEIPTFGVLSCAEHYARCAVKCLSLLNKVDEISFGSEDGNINSLRSIANLEESEEVKSSLSQALDAGESYPLALSNALSKHSNIDNIDEILAKPNNILGIEYIRALRGTNIQATTIKRCGNNYNDKLLSMSEYASATSIRNNLQDKSVARYLPSDVLKSIQGIDINEDIIYHSLYQKLVVENEDITSILNVKEGIENRIHDALLKSNNYQNLLENIKTKRYTLSRIKRTLLDVLLGITDISNSIDTLDYITVLAIKKSKLDLLKNVDATIVTRYNDYAKTNHPMKSIDLRANRLYNALSSDKITSHQMLLID